MQTKSRLKGFTLVEILVVFAIISLLAAILFTVFGRVRENGRRATCQNNMRQIALGVLQYVQDYDGRFPIRFLPSEILPKGTAKAIFQCPSASPEENTSENHYQLYGGLLQVDFKAHTFNGRHDTTLNNPSNTFMLLETTSTDRLSHEPAPHFGGANYAFVDGHVKWLSLTEAAKISVASESEQKGLN